MRHLGLKADQHEDGPDPADAGDNAQQREQHDDQSLVHMELSLSPVTGQDSDQQTDPGQISNNTRSFLVHKISPFRRTCAVFFLQYTTISVEMQLFS